jgi:hypothetical protein
MKFIIIISLLEQYETLKYILKCRLNNFDSFSFFLLESLKIGYD